MVRLPNTIIGELARYCGSDKEMSVKEIEYRFIAAGYGPNKARGWVRNLLNCGTLEPVRKTDDGELIVTSTLWAVH